MSPKLHVKRQVELTIPSALYGGDPRGLLEHLCLGGRPLGNDRWSIWPDDQRTFIACHDLADDTGLPDRYDHLASMPDPNINLGDPHFVHQLNELKGQLARRMSDAGSDLSAPFHMIQTDVMTSKNSAELTNAVRSAFENIRAMPLEGTGDPAFPHATAHLISATEMLSHRAKLPGILFRFDQDPTAMKTISAIDVSKESPFATSSAWYRDIVGMTHYLGPLLGCLSPRFWALDAGRPPFSVVFSLGRDIAGLRHAPMEPLQLLPSSGRSEPAPTATPKPAACRHAIKWWVNRLNEMFDYLCDPTTFANSAGVYDPYEHQHWMLTFGQLFGLTTALQTSARNHAAQRALMNTLLDTYSDRIYKGSSFEQLCTLKHATKTAKEVRNRMPADAAEVLMPAADAAVESLRRVQDGFFIRRQRNDGNVVVSTPEHTKPQHVEPHRAVAVMLKVLRNATHGFGGMDTRSGNPKDILAERLLVHHDGEMPPDLVYLPYLYLLDTLSHPDRTRKRIAKRVGARAV